MISGLPPEPPLYDPSLDTEPSCNKCERPGSVRTMYGPMCHVHAEELRLRLKGYEVAS